MPMSGAAAIDRRKPRTSPRSFSRALSAKQYLQGVAQEKGRFRSFLLACMKHFLADEWDKAQTLKRGGHIQLPVLG